MKTIMTRMEQGERVWAAEAVLRLSGVALLVACRAAALRLLLMVGGSPPHQTSVGEFVVAGTTFGCLTAGLALLFAGPGLFRLQPRPPRALLP